MFVITLKERLGTLERRCETIYEDRFSGKINEQTFIKMIRKMEAEREEALYLAKGKT